jgi:hypothetical protein
MEKEQQDKLDQLADKVCELIASVYPEAELLANELNNTGPLNLYKNGMITQCECVERVCRFMRRQFVKDQVG